LDAVCFKERLVGCLWCRWHGEGTHDLS
jgi:hypothetical protein